jgi:hypothetical protein
MACRRTLHQLINISSIKRQKTDDYILSGNCWVIAQSTVKRSFLEYSEVRYRRQSKANYVGIKDIPVTIRANLKSVMHNHYTSWRSSLFTVLCSESQERRIASSKFRSLPRARVLPRTGGGLPGLLGKARDLEWRLSCGQYIQ